jgi:hypothetical protein
MWFLDDFTCPVCALFVQVIDIHWRNGVCVSRIELHGESPNRFQCLELIRHFTENFEITRPANPRREANPFFAACLENNLSATKAGIAIGMSASTATETRPRMMLTRLEVPCGSKNQQS